MIWIGWEAVSTDVIVVATALDQSLELVVAREAKGLPVASIPEEREVAAMRNDVVNAFGRRRLPSVLMEPA